MRYTATSTLTVKGFVSCRMVSIFRRMVSILHACAVRGVIYMVVMVRVHYSKEVMITILYIIHTCVVNVDINDDD